MSENNLQRETQKDNEKVAGHMPEPYKIRKQASGSYIVSGEKDIALVGDVQNAVLFAASPVLLAACKEAREFFDALASDLSDKLISLESLPSIQPYKNIGQRIVAAISKAQGGAQ